jgi:hypothetical protein
MLGSTPCMPNYGKAPWPKALPCVDTSVGCVCKLFKGVNSGINMGITSLDEHASFKKKLNEALPRQAFGCHTQTKAHTLIGLCCLKSVKCPCPLDFLLTLHRQGIMSRMLKI